jgi:DNA polymerase III subunit epsilon
LQALDAELTSQVYLELVGGRQRGLAFSPVEIAIEVSGPDHLRARPRPIPLIPRITPEEAARHAAFIAGELGEKAIWAWT